MNDKYLWLSLGENCLTDGILKRYDLKSFSTPYSSGRSNIDYVLDIERHDYLGFLDLKNLTETNFWGAEVVRSSIYNKSEDIFHQSVSNGFEFTHHNPIKLLSHAESLDRKVSRMKMIKGNENIIFLYHHRKNSKSDIASLKSKLRSLSDIYLGESNKCKVVLFHQTLIEDIEGRGLMIKNSGESCIEFEFFTNSYWEGNDPEVFWGEIDEDLISIMIKAIKASI